MAMQPWSPSGLQIARYLKWGSHLAHFFGAGSELRDGLVPYFKADNERCLWVTGRAFNSDEGPAARCVRPWSISTSVSAGSRSKS
jgi:hypothetical protein